MNLQAYEVITQEELKELKAVGYILEHKKTKARVVVISNDDSNKVFTIGFRTPPNDDTGLPHIMEHSVLCGSKKFPAKDPFVELAKGSLNTFLNAMTYSDKTVYPIASCNDKDYHNLIEVYMDAVFYPNIYSRKEILMQEGWHYEMEDTDGPITYNGVVYNEMKGVYSSSEDVLARVIQSSLLKDTPYACESGGDPEYIPNLTYDDFIAFHKKYYHPSNSYIYLYGNMDYEKELRFIDEEYLANYEYQKINSTIKMQPEFVKPVVIETTYSVSETDPLEDSTYLSYNAVIGTSLERDLYLAFQILEYALLCVPGAPIKEALIKAGIGKEIRSSFDNGIRQPIFSIVAKNANKEDQNRFVQVITDTIRTLKEHGIGERTLKAAINHFEFKYKEANHGMYPKGLILGLQSFDSWLYDDMAPFIHLVTEDTFAFLKTQIDTGYFERILEEYLITNPHRSVVVMEPERGLNQRQEEAVAKKLQEYKESLSAKELQQIVDDTKHLKEYQSTPSTKEELETIPMLSIDDIEKKAREIKNVPHSIANIPVIEHPYFTNGIAYVRLAFSVMDLSDELMPYMSLLTEILKYVDTEQFSYQELSNEINIVTGGIGFSNSVVSVYDKEERYLPLFDVRMKALYEHVDEGMQLIEEILFTSKLSDTARLKEIIAECKSGMKDTLTSSGHTTAAGRAASYISRSAMHRELTDGIAFYEFVCDLDEHFEERKEELIDKLQMTIAEILRRGNLAISYTGDREVRELLETSIDRLSRKLSTRAEITTRDRVPLAIKNEGFQTASKVQYVALAGNYKEHGFDFTGALNVLQVIFSYDYLWINVRVKGGAYGSMCNFGRHGVSYFTSYRDPKLLETYEIYKKAPDYVTAFEANERDMTKYIIGAIAKMDMPLTPSAAGEFSFNAFLRDMTEADLQKERDEVLSTTPETIRGLAPLVAAITESGVICAIGDEEKMKENQSAFGEIKSIF